MRQPIFPEWLPPFHVKGLQISAAIVTVEGNTIDARGMTCRELACSDCHLTVPRDLLDIEPLFLWHALQRQIIFSGLHGLRAAANHALEVRHSRCNC
jgi:hypothetical protein